MALVGVSRGVLAGVPGPDAGVAVRRGAGRGGGLCGADGRGVPARLVGERGTRSGEGAFDEHRGRIPLGDREAARADHRFDGADKLTAEDVEVVLRAMARRGLARNTIMRVRATLVLALSHAERRSHVARNVARLAEMPVNAKPAREGRSLTLAEARILLDAARSDPLEAVWVAGLMLGLRPGELTDCCGSTWTSRPPRCRCDDRSRTDRPGCVSVTRRPGVPFGASIYHRRWWRRCVVSSDARRSNARSPVVPGLSTDSCSPRRSALRSTRRTSAVRSRR